MQIASSISSAGINFSSYRSQPARQAMSPAADSNPSTPSTAGSYNFTNMTPKQMQAAMGDLISSGRMTFDESSSLVGMIPTALSKVAYDGTVPEAYNQPKDFINELNAGIQGAESRGDTQNADSLKRSLEALTRLQNSASSAISIDTTA